MGRRIFFSVILSFLAFSIAQAGEIKNINVKDAAELIRSKPESILILDVRTPGEFREGHIPNAENLNFFGPGFEKDLKKLPKDRDLLVYCRSGRRSEAASEELIKGGHKKILHMNEGFSAWEKARLPVEK